MFTVIFNVNFLKSTVIFNVNFFAYVNTISQTFHCNRLLSYSVLLNNFTTPVKKQFLETEPSSDPVKH